MTIKARVLSETGPIAASLPLRIDLTCGNVQQTVYATTTDGMLSWTAPFLRTFAKAPMTVAVMDLASGKCASRTIP